MNIAVCSIQKNRGPWLVEWVAFHHLVGVTDFVLYMHECSDDTHEVVAALQKLFRIRAFALNDIDFAPQLRCYAHACQEFVDRFDWMAFLDGDEFLFPTRERSLQQTLARYQSLEISALAPYWRCFGSAGHVSEPQGLITQNYQRASAPDFEANHHVKSIIRGGAKPRVTNNSHYFLTEKGSFDEHLHPVTAPFDMGRRPSWDHLRINHYVTQSREYFEKVKQASGAADAGPKALRSQEWWTKHDRNDVHDTSMQPFAAPLAALVDGICAATGLGRRHIGGMPRWTAPAAG